MENKEFDKFIREAAKEEQEVPSFLEWGNMIIPVKKKRRVVPFWFVLVFIGAVGVASVWWVVGNRRDASSALTEDAAPIDKGDVGSTGGGERGTTTVPKHLEGAFYAWLNDDCIDTPGSPGTENTDVASIAEQRDTATGQIGGPVNPANPSLTASSANVQATSASTTVGSAASGTHPPAGEKKKSDRISGADDFITDLPTAGRAELEPTAVEVQQQSEAERAENLPTSVKNKAPSVTNLALMTPRSPRLALPQAMELLGSIQSLPPSAKTSRRSFYIGVGTNTYRNLGEANAVSSANFGLTSLGQSFSFGWIQPAKGMVNLTLGLTYNGLHHYYEGTQDLGYENDFEAGQRIKRERIVRHNNRIHLLQLDAGVHSAFNLGSRWDAFVWFRLSPGWNLRSSGRLLLDNRDDVLVLEESAAPSDLIVSATVSAGLNYWLNERAAFVLRPSYTRHLSAFALSDKLEAKVKPEVIDLCIGVHLRLKR